jgi:Tfp pilus assembly protein PilN
MKLQFDLLPKEYKSFPRDTLGIALAFLAIVTTISAVGSMSLKNRKEQAAVQTQIETVETRLREMVQKTGSLQPPVNEINSLKSSIAFINQNLDTPGTSWVDFFATLEAAVPERVVILDIAPKTFNDLGVTFTIAGEASSIFDALEFAKRLNQSGKFNSMLKTSSNTSQNEGTVQKFSLEFSYLGKK